MLNLIPEEMEIECNRIRDLDGGLHLGCGGFRRDKAINVDLYDTRMADLQADAAGPLPFEDGRFTWIETQQMIEHLTVPEYEKALAEWTRLLKPKGYLIIGTFDLEKVFTGFPFELTKMNVWMWRTISWMIYGSQACEGQYHKSAWAPDYLVAVLEKLGYKIASISRGYPPRPTPTVTVVAQKC